MKLVELIAELEHLAEYAGEDAEVMIATQPSYPLQAYVATVTLVGDTIYIAEGGQPWSDPYAPRAAWEGGLAISEDEDED
jgi:hypothetical protein